MGWMEKVVELDKVAKFRKQNIIKVLLRLFAIRLISNCNKFKKRSLKKGALS